MQVLYGTTNQAKFLSMKEAIKGLDIEIIGLKDLNKPIPIVDEDGENPLENAKRKAQVYYNAFKMPVFSCDSGLYFEDLQDSLQPGTHVRRINDKQLTDEEMIVYYANLAKRHDGQLIANYHNAIYFIFDEGHKYFCMDESLMSESFILVSKPHHRRIKGYPLDSLSVEMNSMAYYYDLKNNAVDASVVDEGFKSFFAMVLSKF